MHTSLSLHFIDVQCLDMFRALVDVSWCQDMRRTAHNIHHFYVRVVPPEDGQIMPETYRDIEHQLSVSESEVCIKLVVFIT
jgi:hypothetical protein